MDKDEYQNFLEFQKWKKLQMENKSHGFSEKQMSKTQSLEHNKHKVDESLSDYWNDEDISYNYDDDYYDENEMYDYGIEDDEFENAKLAPSKTQYTVAKGGKLVNDNEISNYADDVLALKIKVEVQEALFKILKDYIRKDEIDLYLSKSRSNSNFKQKDYNNHEDEDEDDGDDYYEEELDENINNSKEKAFNKIANKLKEKEEKNKSPELIPKEWKLASQKLDEVISVQVPIAGSDQMMESIGTNDDSWIEDAIQ